MVVTVTAWVSLGCNLGNRGQALALLRQLLQRDGTVIERSSSEILTRPIGVTGQEDFHNQVLRLRSTAPRAPRWWLEHCRHAEVDAGRKPTYRWGPRRADVDLLLLGAQGEVVVDSVDLVVPHPELPARPFLHRLLGEVGAPAAPAPQMGSRSAS